MEPKNYDTNQQVRLLSDRVTSLENRLKHCEELLEAIHRSSLSADLFLHRETTEFLSYFHHTSVVI